MEISWFDWKEREHRTIEAEIERLRLHLGNLAEIEEHLESALAVTPILDPTVRALIESAKAHTRRDWEDLDREIALLSANLNADQFKTTNQ